MFACAHPIMFLTSLVLVYFNINNNGKIQSGLTIE